MSQAQFTDHASATLRSGADAEASERTPFDLDPDSYREFAAQLLDRTTEPPNYHPVFTRCRASTPNSPSAEQYFPPFLRPDPAEHVIDCGAYTGDTLGAFLRWSGGSFARYTAIEPDVYAYRELIATVRALPIAVQSRISVVPLGLSYRNEKIPFLHTGHPQSHASHRDDASITQFVTLDFLLPHAGPPPTFLKMDIEGMEFCALVGGTRTIIDCQPVLAVCIYHQPDHLWNIPALLAAWCPQHRIVIRHYSEINSCETVCYAIPPDRLDADRLTLRPPTL